MATMIRTDPKSSTSNRATSYSWPPTFSRSTPPARNTTRKIGPSKISCGVRIFQPLTPAMLPAGRTVSDRVTSKSPTTVSIFMFLQTSDRSCMSPCNSATAEAPKARGIRSRCEMQHTRKSLHTLRRLRWFQTLNNTAPPALIRPMRWPARATGSPSTARVTGFRLTMRRIGTPTRTATGLGPTTTGPGSRTIHGAGIPITMASGAATPPMAGSGPPIQIAPGARTPSPGSTATATSAGIPTTTITAKDIARATPMGSSTATGTATVPG